MAFAVATRYRKPIPILLGIFVATVLNHLLAAGFGSWISEYISVTVMKYILIVSFLAFAVWTLKPDELDEVKKNNSYGPFLTTTILFFLAEMGDKTQLATVALGARFHSTVLVTTGTTLGMMLSDGLAVLLGDQLVGKVNLKYMRWATATLFLLFAAAVAISLLFPETH